MFAVLIIHNLQNAGCRLAFTVQAFFMPGHEVYHNWYPCTPVWSVNAPAAFCRCDKQRDGHGYLHFKHLLLCLTMTKLSPLLQTASERPPTKRVVSHPSPSPAILTPILPLAASTSTDAPSATCDLQTLKATSSPDDSTSPVAKRQPVPYLTKPSFSSSRPSTESGAATWTSVTGANANATMPLGCRAIPKCSSTTATSHLCNSHPQSTELRHFLQGLPHRQPLQEENTLKDNNTMYTTSIFETAAISCGYSIESIRYNKHRLAIGLVGLVPIFKKQFVNGHPETVCSFHRYRWDSAGQCFTTTTRRRIPIYDLPLRTIFEHLKLKEEQLCM